MKTRLIQAVALAFMVGGLTVVGVHVATADTRPPASWEHDNPARCPYPHQTDRKPPFCDDMFYTPTPGSPSYLGTPTEATP